MIGKRDFVKEIAELNCSGVFITKSHSKSHLPIISKKNCNNSHILKMALHAEGLTYYSSEGFVSEQNISQFSYYDVIFTWSTMHRKILLDATNDLNVANQLKIIDSYHPRFEICNEKFNILFKKETFKILNQYGNFILVSTNFAWGSTSKGYTKPINHRTDIKLINKRRTIDIKMLKTYVNLIEYLASNTKLKVVIRPHPSEDYSFWMKKFESSKKIFVDYRYNINPWLIASRYVVHFDSTSGIEAYLYKKNVIVFNPLGYSSKSDVVTDAFNYGFELHTKEEVLKYINSSTFIHTASKDVFDLSDHSKEASTNIISTINSALNRYNVYNVNRLFKRKKVYLKLFILKLIYISKLYVLFGKTKIRFLSRMRIFPYLTKNKVKTDLRNLNKVFLTASSYKISRIMPDTYSISKK